jgi:hypothetical protein
MTKSEKELTRVKALRENRAAFNVLRNALASCDELSFAAYKLRNIRYALKRARGIGGREVSEFSVIFTYNDCGGS